MATVTTIEWTERTWNPVTGCSKVSQGCKHCYAERIADRFWGDRPFTEVQCHPERLGHPKSIRKGSMFFVNSMSDLFHPGVPEDFIHAVFKVMAECPQHTFQVLTKRSERLADLAADLPWPDNVWMGVSVEDANVIDRIDHLRTVPAAVRFLSLEPLIGPLENLDLTGIQWVIVGGESGPGARAMRSAWVRSLRRQCRAARVPFFFKQWGGVFKKHSGRELDGRIYNEFPNRVIPLGSELFVVAR
jgi:protein gp37